MSVVQKERRDCQCVYTTTNSDFQEYEGHSSIKSRMGQYNSAVLVRTLRSVRASKLLVTLCTEQAVVIVFQI